MLKKFKLEKRIMVSSPPMVNSDTVNVLIYINTKLVENNSKSYEIPIGPNCENPAESEQPTNGRPNAHRSNLQSRVPKYMFLLKNINKNALIATTLTTKTCATINRVLLNA